jgi:hypothetical protein
VRLELAGGLAAAIWSVVRWTVMFIGLQSRGFPPGINQRVVQSVSTLWFLVMGLWRMRSALLLRTAHSAGA